MAAALNGALTDLARRFLGFFVENAPSWRVALVAGPIALAWAFAGLALAGWLKQRRGWRTGDTRKLFHFHSFGSVAVAQLLGGTPLVGVVGGMISLVVLLAIVRGDGDPRYEALAREKDAPRRTHFIVVPWLATFLGGVTSNVLFGPLALVGYLVSGIGDAIAEPIGIRFGRHRYRVPSLAAVPATRSLEGSAAVFVGANAAIVLSVALLPGLAFAPRHLLTIPALALLSTVVEALSPHGWDNATLQIVPAWAATALL